MMLNRTAQPERESQKDSYVRCYPIEGRTLDQTEAFTAGFVQARVDARSNFQGTDIPVGFSSPCSSVSARVTLQDRLNFRPTPLAQ